MGEGIYERIEEGPEESENPMNTLNNLEGHPFGNDNEEDTEEEHPMEEDLPTAYSTTASGQVSKLPACLIKEIGEAALSAAK